MSKQIKKNVKMIDVGGKKITKRTAIAEAFINTLGGFGSLQIVFTK